MHISKELNWLWKLHENSWVRGLFGSHNFFTASTWSQGTYRWSHIINRRDLISNLVHVAQPFLDEAHPSIAKLATSHLDNEVGRQLGGIRISFASNIAMTDCHLHVSHRISKPVSPQNPRWTWSEKRKDACILDWNLHGHGRWWFPKLQSPHCTGISFQSFSGSISLSIFLTSYWYFYIRNISPKINGFPPMLRSKNLTWEMQVRFFIKVQPHLGRNRRRWPDLVGWLFIVALGFLRFLLFFFFFFFCFLYCLSVTFSIVSNRTGHIVSKALLRECGHGVPTPRWGHRDSRGIRSCF